MDRLTEILENAIQAKRNEDFEQAFNYYQEAMSLSPTDIRIHSNMFRLLIGIQEYEDALRRLLIICSYNRMDNLIEKDLKDPSAKVVLRQNRHKFNSTNTLYKSSLFSKVKCEPELIQKAIEKDELLNDLIYRADNLTYYIGHSIVGLNPPISSYHKIPTEGFKYLNMALLGLSAGNDLREHESASLFLCLGFIFAHMNMNYNLNSKSDIVSYYLNENNNLNFNIMAYREYLENLDNRPPPIVKANSGNLYSSILKAQKEENFDSFPVNICETSGSIKREPFVFEYETVDVWHGGKCIFSDSFGGIMNAELSGKILNITLNADHINDYIIETFSFGEISTNINRVIWSKDFFNVRNKSEKLNPDVASLFFTNGLLIKIALNINESNTLIEFVGKQRTITSPNYDYGIDDDEF